MANSNLDLIDEVLPKILTAVRQSVGVAAQDVKFYKSLDKDLASDADECSSRLLTMVSSLIQNIDRNSNEDLEINGDTIQDSWKDIGNIMDGLFEKADTQFDEQTRSRVPSDISNNAAASSSLTYLEDSSSSTAARDNVHNKRIEKPQLNFKTPIDNSESLPFRPKITSKPHAVEPYEKSLTLIEETPDVPSHYKQPYEVEIETQEYPESMLAIREPEESKPWQTTTATWVDNVQALNEMISELSKCTEIAVDLEHHDFRTYYGLVCLMQISSRSKDWIVDTLALRDQLEGLNTVFTNPQIVKVFHGAFMDIIWLQRDLGLYVVSLFDTYHASRLLGFPRHSLAYLLERFANFKTSKKYQLADWRIRPLPDAMMSYARSDTHFLLNIYDQLRNSLIKDDKLKDVLHESRKVSKRRFEYTKFRPNTPSSLVVSPLNDKVEPWRMLMVQYNLPMRKTALLVDLYKWRDAIAREKDESVRYIMPNQLLVSLVASAPTDAHGVLASGNFITEAVRLNAKELAKIIENAVQKSDDEDILAMSAAHEAYEKRQTEEIVIDGDIAAELHDKFRALVQELHTTDEVEHIVIERAKAFISGHHHHHQTTNKQDSFCVDYNSKKAVYHNKHIVDERLERIEAQFLLESDQAASINSAQISLEDNVKEEAGSAAEAVEQPELQEESAPVEAKLDPNEVITLRRKQHNNKNFQRKNNQAFNGEDDEITEAFDYSSTKKIMEAPVKPRGKKQAPKRSFDPYSQVGDGPRAPKKVAKLHSGKTSTFKNKRK